MAGRRVLERAVVPLTLLAATLLVALTEVEAFLGRLQQEGSRAHGIESLGGGLSPRDIVDDAKAAVRLWDTADASAAEAAVVGYTLVDCAFALAYGALVAVVLRRCFTASGRHPWQDSVVAWYREPLWGRGGHVPEHPSDPDELAARLSTGLPASWHERFRRLLNRLPGLLRWAESLRRWLVRRFRPLPVLVCADLVENIARLAAYRTEAHPLAVATAWGAEKLKFAAGAVVLIALAAALRDLVTVPGTGHGRLDADRSWRPGAGQATQRWWRAVLVLRGQVGLAVAFALLLLLDVTGQVGDILRRWTEGQAAWVTGLAGTAAVLLLSLLLWTSARRIALVDRTGSRLAEDTTGASVMFVWVGFLVSVAAIALAVLLGWTLLLSVPVVIGTLLVLELARWATAWTESADDRARKATREGRRIPAEAQAATFERASRLVAVVPVAALGIALVRSASGPLVLSAAVDEAEVWSTLQAVTLLGVGVLVLLAAVALPWVLRGRGEVPHRRVGEDDRRSVRAGTLAEERRGGPADRRTPGSTAPVPTVVQYVPHWALALAALAFGLALAVRPVEWAPVVGSVAVLAVALAVLAVLFAELQRLSEVAAPTRGLAMLGFDRVPVFFVLALWLASASMLDDGSHHDVRTVPAQGGSLLDTDVELQAVDLGQVWDEWRAVNCVDEGDPNDGRAVPLVVLATEGGGIRAAYWTASVLTDLLPDVPVADCPGASPRSRVLTVSGISGGSVGAAAWFARDDHPAGWFEAALGEPDFAATPLAAGLLVDLPRSVVGFSSPDRAAQLEVAWERRNPGLDADFFEALQPGGDGRSWMPVLMLNGAQVETGCRVTVAPILLTNGRAADCRTTEGRDATVDVGGERPVGLAPAAPITVDALQHLRAGTAVRGGEECNPQSLRVSTAALLSARFPYITPSGHLPCGEATGRGGVEELVSVVDGGYADGSGSAGAADIWAQLDVLVSTHNASGLGRQVVPVFVRIDNHYRPRAAPAPVERTGELLTPPVAKLRAVGTTDLERKHRAASTVAAGVPGLPFRTCLLPTGVVSSPSQSDGEVLLSPTTRPGLPAPLAWTLARSSRDDLDAQREDLFARAEARTLVEVLTGEQLVTCRIDVEGEAAARAADPSPLG